MRHSDSRVSVVPNAIWHEELEELTMQAVHTVKNYIAGVMSVSENWLNGLEAEHPLWELTRVLQEKSRQTNSFIEGISDLHRTCSGRMNFHELNRIVEDVVSFLGTVSGLQEVRADRSADDLPVYLDAVELQRVLIVLLFRGARPNRSGKGVVIQSKRMPRTSCPDLPSEGQSSAVILLTLKNLALPDRIEPKGLDEANAGPPHYSGIPQLSAPSDFAKRHRGLLEVEFLDDRHCNLCFCLPEAEPDHDRLQDRFLENAGVVAEGNDGSK